MMMRNNVHSINALLLIFLSFLFRYLACVSSSMSPPMFSNHSSSSSEEEEGPSCGFKGWCSSDSMIVLGGRRWFGSAKRALGFEKLRPRTVLFVFGVVCDGIGLMLLVVVSASDPWTSGLRWFMKRTT